MTHYNHLVEIGAGDRYSSDALGMLARGEVTAQHLTLYEPNAILCEDLRRVNGPGVPSVMVREEAVTSTFRDLYHMGYASYLRGVPSFLATSVEEGGEKWWEPLAREVSCVKVDRMDYGTIDALVLTVNGGEMDVLKGLVSRPKAIWTKHYLHNARQWGAVQEVFNWMHRERYVGRTLATNEHQTYLHVKWTRG